MRFRDYWKDGPFCSGFFFFFFPHIAQIIPHPTPSSLAAVFSSKTLLSLWPLPFLLFTWHRSDVQTYWQRHLLKTERSLRPNRILACGSGIQAFLLCAADGCVTAVVLLTATLLFLSVACREVVLLLVLGPRSEIADEYSLQHSTVYIFPWKHAWCTANSCAFDTKAFVNWVIKLLPWCRVLECMGLIIHRRWLSSGNFTGSQIILF